VLKIFYYNGTVRYSITVQFSFQKPLMLSILSSIVHILFLRLNSSVSMSF